MKTKTTKTAIILERFISGAEQDESKVASQMVVYLGHVPMEEIKRTLDVVVHQHTQRLTRVFQLETMRMKQADCERTATLQAHVAEAQGRLAVSRQVCVAAEQRLQRARQEVEATRAAVRFARKVGLPVEGLAATR